MKEVLLRDVIRETAFPLILFGTFTYICFRGSVKAIRRRRAFKQGGTTAEAEVMQYGSYIRGGRFSRCRETVHSVIVRCVSLEDSEPRTYQLETNVSRARRYAHTDRTELLFIPGEEKPVLPEDMRHIRYDIGLGIFGTVLCGLFTLLFLIAAVAELLLK